jgi:sugar phosphate isomerase/epimerase
MTQIPIALQLFTVRDDSKKDLVATLTQVASIGYKNVELAGLYEQSASRIKNLLEELNLKPISAHVGLGDLEGAFSGKTIEDYLELGVYTFVIPHVGPEIRLEGAGYPALAERLNTIGEKLSTFGIKVGYHNHDFEFTDTFEGKSGFQVLIEQTDPALVTFELDTFWALFAGHDPVDFITKHGTRLSLLHIKDMDSTNRSFAPVGTGSLPLGGIVAAAVDAEVNYLIVEQDSCKGPALEAIATSYSNLVAKGYA